MGSSSRPKKSLLAEKLSLPAALGLWVLSFYAGYLYGGNQLEKLPDIRATSKVLIEGQKPQLEGQSHKDDSIKEILLDNVRRELAKVEPKAPAILSDHGESGESALSEIPYQMLSWAPRAFYFPNFAPKEKCMEIVEIAKKSLAPSGLALRQGETAESTADVRTSSGTFLSSHGNPTGALAWVENKMAKVTMVPVTHGEAYNVLRYELGQKYNSHYDTFNPEEYGPQSSQRIASFLLYLTDVEEGGETMFPFEGFRNMNIGYDFTTCIGLTVKPRQGDALLFWSVFPNGTIDKTSLHGSCPVIKGEKWVATKWIRDMPMRM